MSETRWLTYDEIAEVLGIAPDSARRLVARRKWPRRPGNDGKARIGVPVERIPERQPVTPVTPADAAPDITPDAGGDITVTIKVLTDHIGRLERELETVKGERDAEWARASQVDALQAALDAERRRADEWKLTADRLTDRLTTPEPKRRWWSFRRAG